MFFSQSDVVKKENSQARARENQPVQKRTRKSKKWGNVKPQTAETRPSPPAQMPEDRRYLKTNATARVKNREPPSQSKYEETVPPVNDPPGGARWAFLEAGERNPCARVAQKLVPSYTGDSCRRRLSLDPLGGAGGHPCMGAPVSPFGDAHRMARGWDQKCAKSDRSS